MRNSIFSIMKNSRSKKAFFLNFEFSILNSRSAGFTLLELLISITILAIIVLIIGSAMRLGFRSVRSGEKQLEAIERIRASLSIMDKQIQSGIPLMDIEDGSIRYYFRGQKKLMQFPTNYSLWSNRKGYVTVTYRVLSDDNGKKSLYARENIIGIEDIRETKFLEDYNEIYFEYFYRDPKEETVEWVEELKDDFYIPEKVRLHLQKGSKKFSMIIPVRAREGRF